MLKIKVSEIEERYDACPGECRKLIDRSFGGAHPVAILPCGARIKVCLRCYHTLVEALKIQKRMLSFDPCEECNLEGDEQE